MLCSCSKTYTSEKIDADIQGSWGYTNGVFVYYFTFDNGRFTQEYGVIDSNMNMKYYSSDKGSYQIVDNQIICDFDSTIGNAILNVTYEDGAISIIRIETLWEKKK